MVNNFQTGFSQFNLQKFNFLITLGAVSLARTQEEKEKFYSQVDVFVDPDSPDYKNKFQLSANKLFKFIRPVIKVNRKIDGKSTFFKYSYRLCTLNDFHRKNFFPKQEEEEMFKNRLCPDFGSHESEMQLKNSYTNKTRTSFSIQIDKCDYNQDKSCE